jgi:hypothetical protein
MTRTFAAAIFTLLIAATPLIAARAQNYGTLPNAAPQIPVYQRGQVPPQFQYQPVAPPPMVTPQQQQPTYIVPSGPNGFAIQQNGKTLIVLKILM